MYEGGGRKEEDVNYGLWIMDYGLWIMDYGLWILLCGEKVKGGAENDLIFRV
ncbi:predicted protein [Sclerotinia sclerotiorum 1980 UF-70]|uniref:Uncharacterized protein n=1 Tax=Sclerotinia sclerotiorum (strain ATCC 18683 / 1980 / Ss-1) TaxID=665079 RepID=A7EAW8_SCLS1|nr:predicted protein [Sclerotinia sclerotiorum 1980 UF-70]EDN99596.1 predicted protein [Sclerotinia sclerotiorum 1980 UF-70]